VWNDLADVEGLLACVPGITVNGRREDLGYDLTITVGAGGLRAGFRGSASVEFDDVGRVVVLNANGKDRSGGTRASAIVALTLQDSAVGVTELNLSADVTIKGVFAPFAETVGRAATRRLISDFLDRATAHLGRETGDRSSVVRP
jgi:carbon monoxide dehydrogenase subunit G